MGFWESTLSSALGGFVGILGAYFIASWQIKESQKFNNIPFYIQFNEAQLHINRFIEEVQKILEHTEGVERINARLLLTENNYLELKKNLQLTIKTINKDIKEVDFNNFVEHLGKFNQYAPLHYYKDLNFLIFSMAIIYNLLLEDSKYLIEDVSPKIDIPMSKGLSLSRILKKFRKKYKKMKKKLKI